MKAMAIAFRPRAAWLLTTAMMAWIPAAQAQQAAPAPAESPSATTDNLPNGDIIVTAQKRAQTLIDVPQSISIVSGAVLEQRHATSLVDYAALVPGLSLQQQNAGEARVILRGINTGGSSPTVAIYIDDTPFGSSTGQTNAAHLAGDIDPLDVEGVDVAGEMLISAAEGNGPVNALDVALRKDLGKYQKYIEGLKLIDYRVRILNGGTEAVTRVLIESEDAEGERWTTVGVSPNIIDASFQALMDSIIYKLVKSNAPA
eukprot:gene42124-57038_t